MYMFNGLYINPAYAGSQDVLNVMGIYRHQWSGIEGAPNTTNVSVDAPLRRDQYALGLTVMNDRLGLTNMFTTTGAFAYRIKVKADNIISLGIQGGVTYYQQRNTEAVTNVVDPSFSVNQSLWLPNVGAGIYAYGKRYYLGISSPHIVPFSLDDKWEVATSPAVAHQYNQILVTGGYVFGKDASIVKFRPTFLLNVQKGTNYNMPDIYLNLGLLFIDRLWLIPGIITGSNTAGGEPQKFNVEGFVCALMFKVTPQLGLGYSYHYSLKLADYETGTHEIMINYLFWYNKKRFVTPRYVKYF
jgi:type IX secretion system PorP/SprF family membrane protein